MAELQVTVEVNVHCVECGKQLHSHRCGNGASQWIEVEACPNCTDKAYNEGKDEGQNG